MNKSIKIGLTIFGVVLAVSLLMIYMYFHRTYTVTFDTKGGTIYAATKVQVNQKAVKPIDPVMEGYEFIGWFYGTTDTEYDFSVPITKDVVITAHWKQIN